MYDENKSIYRYKRKLLPIEAAFIRSPGAIIASVAEISGYVDEDKFKYAVKKLRKIHPILNARLVWDKNGESWFHEMDYDFPVSIILRNDDGDFSKVIASEWKKSFDMLKGPLSRFILLKSDIKSEIIFIAHHSLSDGVGMTILIDQILQLMNNPNMEFEVDYGEDLPSIENFKKYISKFKINFFEELKNKSMTTFLNTRWKRTKIYLPPEDVARSHKAFFKDFDYLVLIDEFTEEETLSFINECKKHSVSVNSAMAAAFLAARNEVDKAHDNHRQLIPVDLRKHLGKKAKKSASCYAGSIDIEYTYDMEKSFWENAKAFHEKSKYALNNFKDIEKVNALSYFSTDLVEASMLSQRVLANSETYKEFPYSNKLGKRSNHVAAVIGKNLIRQTPSFTITNMGSPKFSNNYGDLKLEKLILYPSGVSYPRMNILFSTITINNKLFVSYHVAKNILDKTIDYDKTVNLIKERFKKILIKDIYA